MLIVGVGQLELKMQNAIGYLYMYVEILLIGIVVNLKRLESKCLVQFGSCIDTNDVFIFLICDCRFVVMSGVQARVSAALCQSRPRRQARLVPSWTGRWRQAAAAAVFM
jgi:hypothetical protein